MRSSNAKMIVLFAGSIFIVFVIFVLMIGVRVSQASGATGTCITGPGKLPAAVPQPMNSIFTAAAEQYDVPPYVVALLYYGENGSYREPPAPYGNGPLYRSSPVGAQGPFQFMPGTWSTYKNSNPAHKPGKVQDLTDAAFAAAHYAKAELGAKQGMPFGTLADFTKSGTALRVFANYNAGPYRTNLSEYRNTETIGYVTRIDAEYRAHYGPSSISTDTLAETFASNECGGTVEIPTTSTTNGYANTTSLRCYAGTDAGIAQTAKGNAIRLCNVGGFVVNTSISQRVQNLLTYASKDGVTLRGSAFRNPEEQIALRKQNCGTSHYAVYEASSMSCSPPTAIPGTSLHEQGEALDISGVGGYGTHVFTVIRKYAARPDVKLVNTVSGEYWHWDIGKNG